MLVPSALRRPLRGTLLAAAIFGAGEARAQTLLGVRSEDGALFSISAVDATATPLGVSTHARLGDLVSSADGYLYGVLANALPYLVRFDPSTGTTTTVGSLGLAMATEGALAIRADGVAYGFSALTSIQWMFQIDLATGAASGLVPLTGGLHDVNGAVFRSDGLIAAIDRIPNALVTIDVQTGTKTVVQVLTPALGDAGGLAVRNGIAYFTTASTVGPNPGTNELWTIDLYTGAHARVGSLASIGTGSLVGLAGDVIGVGTPFCFGDGMGTACPCGNSSAPTDQAGCRHSGGAGGVLRASGVTAVSTDTVVLHGTSLTNSSALYFQGTATLAGGNGAAFGDGLRCAAGTILRLGTKACVAGESSYPEPGDPSVSVRGAVPPGATRHYQVWYRNAASFCTSSTFNLTNGLTIDWSS